MESSADEKSEQTVGQRRFSERGIGVFMFIGSGVLAYFTILSPLFAASQHEEDVSISLEGVMFVPGLFAIGLVLIFMGDRPSELPGSWKKPVIGITCVVAVGIGILLYEWLKSRLRDYGYAF